MTKMALSSTVTQTYNMKSHRHAPRIRVRSSPDTRPDLPPKPNDADSTDMSGVEEPQDREREFRSRRAHRKSRMGCMRCKQARRKCDEAKPRCSRCVARDADCKYPKHPSTSPQAHHFLDLPAEFDDDFWGQFHNFSLPTPSPPVSAASNAGTALSSTTSSVPSPFAVSPIGTSAESDLSSRPAQALDARESELLSHYLSHTARAFAFDTDDLYALQIGFPSLAFRSRLIMKSMLALAAVCKCHDTLRKRTTYYHDSVEAGAARTREMRDLLALADRYHEESLSQTQAEITGASYYEFAVANAPLMVLYGLASQSIRIQVTQHHTAAAAAAGRPETFSDEFTPAHSQWISLIRAAHEANAAMATAPEHEASPRALDFLHGSKSVASPPLESGSTPDAALIAYDGRSSRDSKSLLLPIISATCHGALEAVRTKTMALHLTASSRIGFVARGIAIGELDQVQACADAVDILVDIASKVCGHGPSVGGSPMPSTSGSQSGRGLALPSWLQDYLARVTNAAPSQASHRTITSFVNKVPTTFLNLVQDILAVIPVDAGLTGGAVTVAENLTDVQKLAMDIMAHWLVFVMLLDDIWWIGEIGGWELSRVAAVMERTRGAEKQWWPESMYRIRDEIEKHR